MSSGEPHPDAKTLSITLRCIHCRFTFPSGIFLSPYAMFMKADIINGRQRCPQCHEMTPLDQEHALALFDGGGFFGNRHF